MADREESRRVAEQIHGEWDFISVEEAQAFYEHLGYISAAEGSVRMSLWVLAKVLEHKRCHVP